MFQRGVEITLKKPLKAKVQPVGTMSAVKDADDVVMEVSIISVAVNISEWFLSALQYGT